MDQADRAGREKVKGHWFNMERAIRESIAQAEAGEPVLVTPDDVIAPKDWFQRWQAIHDEAKSHYRAGGD